MGTPYQSLNWFNFFKAITSVEIMVKIQEIPQNTKYVHLNLHRKRVNFSTWVHSLKNISYIWIYQSVYLWWSSSKMQVKNLCEAKHQLMEPHDIHHFTSLLRFITLNYFLQCVQILGLLTGKLMLNLGTLGCKCLSTGVPFLCSCSCRGAPQAFTLNTTLCILK